MVKLLKSLYGIFSIFLFFQITVLADQSYSVILQNDVQVNNFTYEFDVIIKSNDGEIELTSYQASPEYRL